MKIIRQEKVSLLENKAEYRDFKLISDPNKTATFYKMCCENLLGANEWNKLNLYYPIAKISICDRYGFKINRTTIIGDVIKVEYRPTSDFDSMLCLKINNIKQSSDVDEELFEMVLKVDKIPNLGIFYGYFNQQTNCKIKVRRIINTISTEVKINLNKHSNPDMETINAMISQFPWDCLIKNTLSKI